MVALGVPAGARHLASGATQLAILASFKAPGRVNTGHECRPRARRCWRVLIPGGSWATAEDVGPGALGASEWIYIEHRIHHRRRYGGESEGILFDCRTAGMPRRVARDLRIQCG